MSSCARALDFAKNQQPSTAQTLRVFPKLRILPDGPRTRTFGSHVMYGSSRKPCRENADDGSRRCLGATCRHPVHRHRAISQRLSATCFAASAAGMSGTCGPSVLYAPAPPCARRLRCQPNATRGRWRTRPVSSHPQVPCSLFGARPPCTCPPPTAYPTIASSRAVIACFEIHRGKPARESVWGIERGFPGGGVPI